MSDNLNPCPFCGSKPKFIHHSDYFDGSALLSLGCCGFRKAGRKSDLVNAWNQRNAANARLGRENAALKQQLATQSEDAARLDWLEKFHNLHTEQGYIAGYGEVGTRLIERTSEGWMLDGELNPNQPEFDTLREAIDAAMQAGKGKEK